MTTTLRFDRVVCSRCGGTGHHSYNQVSGTTCFKCGGAKEVFTARGLKQRNLFLERTSVKAGDLKLGDRVNMHGFGKFTIKEMHTQIKSTSSDGGKTWEPSLCFSGDKLGYSCTPECVIQLVLPAAEHNKILAECIAAF